MAPFVAYHGVPAEAHQSRVDELAPQGYRPISLSVSGDPGDPRYAAVWVQRPGTGWWAVHGVDAAGYQARFDELVGQGYAPVLVSATGPASSATFAAVFEQGVNGRWFARHNLRWGDDTDPDTINQENNRAFDQGYVPRCLAVYGEPDDRRFAGVWADNTAPTPWSWWWTPPQEYQRFFAGLVAAGVRPAHVSVGTDGWLVSLFVDRPIGEWWARHLISGDVYQAEFEARVANGLMPIMVQAGGSGDGTRYASVFARDDAVLNRSWTVTGRAGGAEDELDANIRTFMTANAVRAGTVAVARGGTTLTARGYTWAEDGYPITQPGTVMRLASVSKILTSAAVGRLVAAGQLKWDTPAFPLLGITSALLSDQTPDAGTKAITVRQLVVRTSGLQRDYGTDLRGVAARLGITTTPTRDQLVRYLYGEPLAHAPGTAELYSNSAYSLLTSVIEQASGRSYIDVVLNDVLGPLGLTDVWVATTASGGTHPGEVPAYDHPAVSLSQLQPATDAMAPNAYGGDFVLEVGEGSGGLASSAPTIARLIDTYAVWDDGGRRIATRHGDLDGTSTGAFSRGDGL
ncbi:MAG: hypothetical protein QOJ19_1112, partial [Acidimicrobiia bacterium]|nr:hypothetical protein [Acidimicrobiia bacterium]